MDSYFNAAASWNPFAETNGLTPEQMQAGLDKLATGDMPDSTNITKAMGDGSSNLAFAFAAWELGQRHKPVKLLAVVFLGWQRIVAISIMI